MEFKLKARNKNGSKMIQSHHAHIVAKKLVASNAELFGSCSTAPSTGAEHSRTKEEVPNTLFQSKGRGIEVLAHRAQDGRGFLP